jgi:hypothetical protein
MRLVQTLRVVQALRVVQTLATGTVARLGSAPGFALRTQ